MGAFSKIKITLGFVFTVLGATQLAQAGSTTLTFDEFSNSTVLTNQYQSLGVTISGATALTTCAICGFPPVSGNNIALINGPTSVATFTFNSTVIGNVHSVSAYITDYDGPAGIYAYDSSNNLLGSSLLPSTGGLNLLLTVSSQGIISYVTIHDLGSQVAIDNFTFSTAPAYTCAGFQYPFNVALSLNAKTNRAIPLKAQLFDTNNNLVTAITLGTAAPPVVNVTYTAAASTLAVDETNLLNPVGASSAGNQFTFDPTTGNWWFNLGSSPYTASGTYTVAMQSGDSSKYQLSPQCSGTFARH